MKVPLTTALSNDTNKTSHYPHHCNLLKETVTTILAWVTDQHISLYTRVTKTLDDIGFSVSQYGRKIKLRSKNGRWHSSLVLWKREQTCYMTYIDRTPQESKANIKAQFLYFFKTPDAKHLVAKKLKTTSQKPVESVWGFDKWWKDLLIQLDYVIDEQLLIQWFLAGLSQKIQLHIILETFKTYEDGLTKALQVEMDEYFPSYPVDTTLEELLEIMKKSLKELNLKNQDV